MKKLIIILVLILSFQACKKDRLKEDKSILIGTWTWVETIHEYGWCDGESYYEILNPTTENKNFSIEFLKNGIVKFYSENEELIEKKRIVFDDFYLIGELNAYVFDIYLNNHEDERFLGTVIKDSLMSFDFPFKQINEGCGNYKSYFVKQ